MASRLDLSDLIQPNEGPDPGQSDYSSSINVSTVLKDPRFLKDLREHYMAMGVDVSGDTEDDIVDRFYRDNSWRELNTASAVSSVFTNEFAGKENRTRARRIEQVWKQLPLFWQKGGRGVTDFAIDAVPALVLDPVNLIPGGKAFEAAGLGAKAAIEGGAAVTKAVNVGTRAGIVRGAAVDAGINAGQEAIVSGATQLRDQELGLQNEFDTTQFLTSTIAGGGVGGVAGGLLSAIPARIGAKRGAAEAQLPAPDIVVPEAPPAVPAVPVDPVEAEFAPRTEILNQATLQLRLALDRQRQDQVDESVLASTREALNTVAGLRQMVERFKAEAREIGKLEATNDVGTLATARTRRENFERALEDFTALSRSLDKGGVDKLLESFNPPRPELSTSGTIQMQGGSPVDQPKPNITISPGQPQATEPPATTIQMQGGQTEAPSVTIKTEQPKAPEAQPVAPAPEIKVPEPKPQLKPEERGSLLADGVDYRTGSKAPSSPDAEDNYASSVKNILTQALDKVDATGVPDLSPETVRSLVEVFSKSQKDVDPEDVLALYDHSLKKAGFSQNIVEFSSSEKTRIRALARTFREQDPNLTREEAVRMAEGAVFGQRSTRPDNKPRTASGEIIQGPKTRETVSPQIERASIYTTAGRQFTSGKINSFLKKGLASSKVDSKEVEEFWRTGPEYADRSTNTAGLKSGETSFVSKSTMARDEAYVTAQMNARLARRIDEDKTAADKTRALLSSKTPAFESIVTEARKHTGLVGTEIDIAATMLASKHGVSVNVARDAIKVAKADKAYENGAPPTIVPFTTTKTETIFRDHKTGAKTEIPAGQIAWLDGVSGKVYPTQERAMAARGYKMPTSPVLATPAPTGTPTKKEAIEALLAAFKKGGDVNTIVKDLEAMMDGPKKAEDEVTLPLPTRNGRFVIMKNRLTGEVRMINPKQVNSGATVKTVLGKSAPDQWDFRYANPEDFSHNPSARATAFERAEPMTAADTPLSTDRMDLKTAGETKVYNISDEEAEAIATISSSSSKTLSAGETKALVEKNGISVLALHNKYVLANITKRIPADAASQAAMISQVRTLATLMKRVAPNGVLIEETARKTVVDEIDNIFARYPAETVVAAKRAIQNLGGDRNIAPKIVSNSEGDWRANTNYKLGQDRILVPDAPNRGALPPYAKLLHEVAHWAYRNILEYDDHIEFLTAMSKYYGPSGTLDVNRLMKRLPIDGKGSGAANAMEGWQEVFANQFMLWHIQKRDDGGLKSPSLWSKVAEYIKAIFDRFFDRNAIDPDLERMFSKILPEDERKAFQDNRGYSPEVFGDKKNFIQAVDKRYRESIMVQRDLEDAFRGDNPETIVNAARNLLSYIGSIAPSSARGGADAQDELTKSFSTFGPLRKSYNLLRDRALDLAQIIGNKTEGVKEVAPDLQELGLNLVTTDYEKAADLIKDLYDNGHLGDFKPLNASKGDPRFTSLRTLFSVVRSNLEAAYLDQVGKLPNATVPPSISRLEAVKTLDPGLKAAVNKVAADMAAAKEATKAAAVANARTPKSERTRSAGTPSKKPDGAVDKELLSSTQDELISLYKQHAGTPRGDQISMVLLQKIKAQPLTSQVSVPRAIFNMKMPELQDGLMRALHEGGPENAKQAEYMMAEIRRRTFKAQDKENKLYQPIVLKVVDAISAERADNMGLASSPGIPPSARAGVREMLSYVTHRDPEIEYGARTMLYRMTNLLKPSIRQSLDSVNVMPTTDMKRMAGFELTGNEGGAYFDFTTPEFANLRRSLRRITIGLTKESTSTPFDAIHEISHLVANHLQTPKEQENILNFYRAANDETKKLALANYANQFSDLSPDEAETRIAHEWWAETMTKFMAGQVSRGDIYSMSATGDFKLRGLMDRSIKNFIEYVSYLINGLVGRDSVKQQFRRLFLYGDMFEGQSSIVRDVFLDSPAIPARMAAEYVNDTKKLSSLDRQAKINRFHHGSVTAGLDGENHTVLYHGTLLKSVFDRNKNPNASFRPSVGEQYFGPGTYLSEDYLGASLYSEPGFNDNIERQINALGGEDSLYKLNDEFDDLSRNSTHLKNIIAGMESDLNYYKELGVRDEDMPEDFSSIPLKKQLVQDMLSQMKAIMDAFAEKGIEVKGVVLPVYARVVKPADFRRTTQYNLWEPKARAIMDAIESYTSGDSLFRKGWVFNEVSYGDAGSVLDGEEFYSRLIHALSLAGIAQPRSMLSSVLQDAGYDGLRVTEIDYSKDTGKIVHDAFVIFDSANIKHIDADEFNYADSRLYNRELPNKPAPLSGGMVRDIVNGAIKSPSEYPSGQIGDALEAIGVSSPLVDSISSIMRGRNLSSREENALRKAGWGSVIQSQSARMESIGANWLAQRYKEFFPSVYEQFGKLYMPLHDAIYALPGTKTGIARWAHRATGDIFFHQPDSHIKIVRALRMGDGTRQERVLSTQERTVYAQIKASFRNVLRTMRDAGVPIGDVGENYVPQVWAADKIAANEGAFKTWAIKYFETERADLGIAYNPEDAKKFADQMFLRLSDESENGVYFPPQANVGAGRSDHIDYTRMIQLQKYPGLQEEAEAFLENDLQSILVKYNDAAARRLASVKHFGNAIHGVRDYWMVLDQGVAGVAKLLSTPRVFKREIRALTDDGHVEIGQLESVVSMPFRSPADAREFADKLVQTYKDSGEMAARKMLDDVAPRTSNGETSIAYNARKEAILGGLGDLLASGTMIDPHEFDVMEEAMRVAQHQPLTGGLSGSRSFLKTTRAIRNFNSLTLLGFTTLSSFTDIALPVVRSGEFKAWHNAVRQMATDKDYARLIRNTAVAAESIVHEHMTNLYGTHSGRTTNAFFNATLLTPWTDLMRRIAGATGYETFKIMQERAIANYKPGVPVSEQPYKYKMAHRFLSNYGLQDFLPDRVKGNVSIGDRSLMASDEQVRLGILKFANDAVFQPNPNDIPLWAQTPVGLVIWQLKSYPLLMARMAKDVFINDIRALWRGEGGDPRRAIYMLSLAPALGATSLATKDIIQMRGGEDNRDPEVRKRNILKFLGYDEKVHGNENDFLGWYAEGLLASGGLGIILETIHDIASQVDNGAYGKVRMMSTIAGPTLGTAMSAVDVVAGATDMNSNSNAKERAAMRELMRRIPVAGQVSALREGAAEAVAGPARSSNSTGGGPDGWGELGW